MRYEIVTFENDEVKLDVNASPGEDTVWLSKEEMAILFQRDRSVISRHIANIYKKGELLEESTCAKKCTCPFRQKAKTIRKLSLYAVVNEK